MGLNVKYYAMLNTWVVEDSKVKPAIEIVRDQHLYKISYAISKDCYKNLKN